MAADFGASDHTPARYGRAMPWAVSDLPDLTGTTALVTGANSGIGSEPAAALASIQALAERGHGSLALLVKQRGVTRPRALRCNRWGPRGSARTPWTRASQRQRGTMRSSPPQFRSPSHDDYRLSEGDELVAPDAIRSRPCAHPRSYVEGGISV